MKRSVRQEIIWVKNETQYNSNPHRFKVKDSRIYWLSKPLKEGEKEFKLTSQINKWGNIWYIPSDNGAKIRYGKFNHPSTFPLFLILSILYAMNLPKDTKIFDPYLGSGTTAKAAQLMGLDYFGCDIDPEYIKICKDRLKITPPFDNHIYKKFMEMIEGNGLDLGKWNTIKEDK